MAKQNISNFIHDGMFLLEKVDWHGKPAIKKTPKASTPKTRVDRVKNDVYGMEFFAKLTQDNPELNLYVPKIYEAGESYYIREYIDDQPVVDESAPIMEAASRLNKLAQLLAGIDRLEPYGEVRFAGSSNYKNLHASIGRWADENVADGLVSPAQADQVKAISANLGTYIKPRIAHGDMSPYKHAYLRNDGKIALIDFENFSPQVARYFDVAWTYTRLYSFAVSADIPRQFLASFLAKADPTAHQTEQLMAVIIQRTLGMQKDLDADFKTSKVDHRARGKELLELVLQNRLELLHS